MSGIIRSDAGLDSYQYVLSRTVKVPHSAPSPTVIKCLQSNQLTDWDLVITETSGTTNIKITLTISNENGSYSIIQPIGFGGGWKYQGFGSVLVEAEAVNASTGTLVCSLTPPTFRDSYISVGNSTTYQLLAAAATWYPVENLTNVTPAGYTPPFCNRITLYPSFTAAYQFVDGTGAPVYFTSNLLKTDPLWRNIPIMPWYQLEVAGLNPGTGLTALWNNGG